MALASTQHLLSGCHHLSAPRAANLQRGWRQQIGLQQQHQVVKARQHTRPQVAAYPAFLDDNRPTGGGAGSTALSNASEQPAPLQQQQQQSLAKDQKQRWFMPTPWTNGQQQQTESLQLQQQPQQQLLTDVSAALQMQQEQQRQQPVDMADGDFDSQLQQCARLEDITALVHCQQQEQSLTLQQMCAVVEQVCNVTRVTTLTRLQQQQVQQCCAMLADMALQQLPQLGHTETARVLAMFQVVGYRPEGVWVRSVLQHAGTGLVHYTPAELALLLLSATQASVRCGAIPPPDAPVMQLLPSGRVPQPSSFESLPLASISRRQLDNEQQQQQQQQQRRRGNTVLTSAWLQHFLATFQSYIACRTAHPQLAPGHMEAVITCLATLRVAPDRSWMYLFVRQMSAQLPQCRPGSVVRMLGALATLGYRLPDHVLLQVERQIGTSAAMMQLRAEECVEVVRSVAVLRTQQTKPSDTWLQGLMASAVRGSRHLSASAVIGLLAATAALGLQLAPSWVDVLLLQARAALSSMTPHEHVSLIDALSQQHHQYRPGPVFMSVFLAQVAPHLPELSLSQQSALATALATVGYKPGANWMAAFMTHLLAQPATGADGEDLLQLLRSLRRMQYVPAPNVAQQLSGLIDSIQLSVPYNLLLLLREALDELQYQGGIMAVPLGPRRAVEAAAAAAQAAAAAAANTMPTIGDPREGSDIVAVEGVVDAAAVQASEEAQAAQNAHQQVSQSAAMGVMEAELRQAVAAEGLDYAATTTSTAAQLPQQTLGSEMPTESAQTLIIAKSGGVDSRPPVIPAAAVTVTALGAVEEGVDAAQEVAGVAQESVELFA